MSLKNRCWTAMKLTVIGGTILSSQSIVASECPTRFFDLPIPNSVSTCNAFTDKLPATLSFHAQYSPYEMKAFYKSAGIKIASSSDNLGRHVLVSANDQYRIIISQDGKGTQVDLLANQ